MWSPQLAWTSGHIGRNHLSLRTVFHQQPSERRYSLCYEVMTLMSPDSIASTTMAGEPGIQLGGAALTLLVSIVSGLITGGKRHRCADSFFGKGKGRRRR